MFVLKNIWQRLESGRIVHVGQDVPQSELFAEETNSSRSQYTCHKFCSYFSYEESDKNCDHTKLTFLVQVYNVKQSDPVEIESNIYMNDFRLMREHFCKDREIDDESRKVITDRVLNEVDTTLTVDELNEIQQARVQFQMFKDSEGKAATFGTNSEFVSAVGVKVGEKIWCKLGATVRCSGVEALAFVLDVTSRSLMNKRDVEDGKRVLEDEGNTRVVNVVEAVSSKGSVHHLSMMVRRITWQMRDIETRRSSQVRSRSLAGSTDQEIMVAMTPTVWDDIDSHMSIVGMKSNSRGFLGNIFSLPSSLRLKSSSYRTSVAGTKMPSTLLKKCETACIAKIVQVHETECSIEMLVETPGKYKPRKTKVGPLTDANNAEDTQITLDMSLREQKDTARQLTSMYDFRVLSTMHMRFQRYLPLDVLNQQDGTVMGKILTTNSSGLRNARERRKKLLKSKLGKFFRQFESMKKLKAENKWFEAMLEAVILGATGEGDTSRHNELSLSRVELLREADGYTLGSSFLYYMGRSANGGGAIASWLDKHPPLQEFYEEHRFFPSLMREIGEITRSAETWHKMALSVGTALSSMIDGGSDFYTIIYYRSIGEYDIAEMMLAFVLLSLGLQLTLVVAIHHRSKMEMLTSMFGTLAHIKPGLCFWRVLTNARSKDHATVPPVSEMAMSMISEVFAESIPMTVLQVYKILKSETIDPIVLTALFASVAITASTVSYLTYTKDIDDESRRTGRLFYGFIPLSGIRLIAVYGAMHVLSFSQLMAKSITIGILVHIGGKRLAIAVLSCEVGIYLIYKVLRKDFRYFLHLPQKTSIAVSLIIRIAMKVVADFTGILHARHPYEMGGAYWLFNMFYTQGMTFCVLWVRMKSQIDTEELLVLDGDRLWALAAFLSTLWSIALLLLLLSVEKGFKHTFCQLMTAPEYNKAMFDTGDDEYRMYIFTDHEAYYMWYKDEIKEWLENSWERFNFERPPWFTEEASEMIPFNLIPYSHLSDKDLDKEECRMRRERKQNLSARITLGRVVYKTIGKIEDERNTIQGEGIERHQTVSKLTEENPTPYQIAAEVASQFKDEIHELWENDARETQPTGA